MGAAISFFIAFSRAAVVCFFGCIFACTQNVDSQISTLTDGFVTTDDGVRIYYVEKGSGPDVLIAPLALYLEPHLLDRLSKNMRVVFYDPRNRGQSDRADLSSISLDRQVKDLEVLRDALGIEKMALLGWSSLGMEMAVYSLRHPDRVTRLVQLSSLPPAASMMRENSDTRAEIVDRTALETLDHRAGTGEFEETPEKYCRLRYAITVPADFVNTELAKSVPDTCVHENEWRKNIQPYFGALFASMGDYDWRDNLRDSTVPRLIIHGREDRIPLEGAKAWATGYAAARLLTLSPSGHFSFIEQKEAVVAAIQMFLAGEWPQDAVSIRSESG